MHAGFRYPACKIAKMFGWDGKYDAKGSKLVNTLYNAGKDYDRDIWVRKMDNLLSKKTIKKKIVIITDMEDRSEYHCVSAIDNKKVIICGGLDDIQNSGIIDIYVDSSEPICYIVDKIMEKIKEEKC